MSEYLGRKRGSQTRAEYMRDYNAKYRATHAEDFKAYKAAWYAEHSATVKQRTAQYAKEHREQANEANRAWRKRNRDKIRITANTYVRNYKARRKGASGSFTPEQWEDVLRRQGGRCLHCDLVLPLERDHIIPLSRGGCNCISNIQGLCRACNSRKRDRILPRVLQKEAA